MSEEESSVLFSLKELMTIEEDRIKQEEGDRAKAHEEAERARLVAERRAREAEDARRRAEEQRRMQEELRQKEEATRLDAIRHAEIETARTAQEQKARMEAMTVQQAHERQLAALKQDEKTQRMGKWLVAAAVIGVLVVGGGGFAWYRYDQEQKRILAAEQAEKRRIEEEKERKDKELQAKLAEIDDLSSRLNKAADPEEIEKLKREIENAKSDASKLGGTGRFRPPPKSGDAEPKKACAPGDPLCSDI
jgi:colicin import membrane protein